MFRITNTTVAHLS